MGTTAICLFKWPASATLSFMQPVVKINCFGPIFLALIVRILVGYSFI